MKIEINDKFLRYTVISILSVAFVAGSFFGAKWFMENKPKARQKKQSSLTPNVKTITLRKCNQQVTVEAMGIVIPSRETTIKSRVVGEIVRLNANFIPGGIIKKGESVIGIDKTDYTIVLKKREAALIKAKSDLELEKGQQFIAKKQYKKFGNSSANEDLILRKPQERSRLADVAIAEAELNAAKLDLERTEIKAPFHSVIIAKSVEIGDQVSLQTNIATLANTDSYWVRVSVPLDDLKWLSLPDPKSQYGSKATIKTANGIREGRVIKLLGDLEKMGRMARILVEVKDPLNIGNGKNIKAPLLLGEVVKVNIAGKTLKNCTAIPRVAFRHNKEIWLLTDDNKLKILTVTPIWESHNCIFIENSLLPDSKLIVSDLGFSVEGMTLVPLTEGDKSKGKDGDK